MLQYYYPMMKNFKHVVYLLLIAFTGIILLSGFCLAMGKHSCCQPQASDCPILSKPKASTPKNSKIIKPAPAKPLHNHKIEKHTIYQDSFEYIVDFQLPNLYLASRLSHQTTAPPRA